MKRSLATFAAALGLAALLTPGAAWALTISPPGFDFSADPGTAISDAVRLRNDGHEAATLRAEALNFAAKAGDETSGTPDFYPANEERDGRGLAPWIVFDKNEVTLAPGEIGGFSYRIQVPKNASPGSYFGAVLVTSVGASARQDIGVIGNAAVLITLKVNGAVIEDLKLASFSAAPRVASSPPIEFEARVLNGGTVHLRPIGDVIIRNMFGKTVATLPMNRSEYKSVLPGQARRYVAQWLPRTLPAEASVLARQWSNFALGPYTADVSMEYGAQKKILTASTRFWVMPWLVLVLAAGGLVVLVFGARALLHWYQRRVIRDYERMKKE